MYWYWKGSTATKPKTLSIGFGTRGCTILKSDEKIVSGALNVMRKIPLEAGKRVTLVVT